MDAWLSDLWLGCHAAIFFDALQEDGRAMISTVPGKRGSFLPQNALRSYLHPEATMIARYASPLLLLTASCGEAVPSPASTDDRLTAVTWTLHRLDRQPVEDRTATLRFMADHRIRGSSLCNTVTSPEQRWNILGIAFRWDRDPFTWRADAGARAGTFDSGLLVTTEVGCLTTASDRLADRFWQKMQQAERWSLTDRTLTIRFANGGFAILLPRAR